MLGNTGDGIRGWSNFSFGSGHSNTVRPIPDVAKNFRGHKLPMSTEWLEYEHFSDSKLACKSSSSRKPNLRKTKCLISFATLIERLALIRTRWHPYRHHQN